MIKGAIFDMDGTLLDSMPIWKHASEYYLNNQGIAVQENLAERLFSMSMRDGALYVKRNYKLPEDVEDIVAGVNRIVSDFYYTKAVAKPGVVPILKLLREAGIPMVVATSTDRPLVEAALKRTGLLSYFEKIFTCTEVGAGKVKPDIYRAARETLKTAAKETWVFEDALYAAKTAKTDGFFVVGVYDAASHKQQGKLRELADIYIEDFTETFPVFQKEVQKR